MANGWVDQLYLAPPAHLTYPGFGWVQPLPAPWLHLVVAAVGAAGVAIALGWRYRLACWSFLGGFAYLEAIDATLYLNHYWFVSLCALLLAVVPAHHHWSLDARAGRVRRSSLVPAGVIWALRAQVGLVYLFAGLAKLNADWQIERAGGHPVLIVATAHLIADQYRRGGVADVEVRADAWVSMNGRPAQRIIDPTVDLAAQSRTLAPAPWILQPGDG